MSSLHRNIGGLVLLLLYWKVLCPEGVFITADGTYHLRIWHLARRHKGRTKRVLTDLIYLAQTGFVKELRPGKKGWYTCKLRDQEELIRFLEDPNEGHPPLPS